MSEKERDFSTLDLEDIIREFGGGKYPAQSEDMVNTADLLEVSAAMAGVKMEKKQEMPEEAPAEKIPEEKPEREMPDEPTIRLEKISEVETKEDKTAEEAQAGEPTIRLERISDAAAEEAAPEETVAAAEENEYDDEDDDEVEIPHLPPLIFKPKSKLQQLRSELVAGPEKRYYELTEIGVGKLQLAILVCLVMVVLSGTASVMYTLGMIAEKRLRLMVFCQIFAMLMGGLLGSHQMIDGLADLVRGRFSLNTLLCFTFAACCVDGVFCLMEERIPLCAAFALQVAMSLWATYHKRTTEMGQMDSLRKAVRLDSVVLCEDFHEGKNGFLRSEGHVNDFMEHYDELSAPEKRQNRFALLCLLAAIGVAVLAGVRHSVSMAFQILSATLLVAAPASMFVSLTRPAAVLERKLHSLGTVLCGWNGVKGLCGKGVLPLKDKDLFPTGSAKLNGVKFYGDRDPDEVIAYAAALICTNGGGLVPIFEQLLKNRNGVHYNAENLQYYGNGGIGGEVCAEPVLIGTLDFLKEMGVEVPEGTMVKQAVYVCIDGEFSGLFAINYSRAKFTAGGLATLNNYRKVTPVVIARDFMLTPAFLKEKFGVDEKRLEFPDRMVRDELAAKRSDPEEPALALTTQEGLAPAAYAITGSRALRTAYRMGMAIHITGGVLGILIMLALAIVGAVHLLTPAHILLYQLVWMVPGLLVTMWPRTI